MTTAHTGPRPRIRSCIATALAGAVAALGLVAIPATPAAADAPPRRLVSGWLRPAPHMSSALASVSANADLWSDASPFWFSATGATTINGTADAAVVSTLRSKGVLVLPSVTETLATPAMEAMLANAAQRAAHVQAITDLVTSNGFDGIDLDYESMNFGGTAAQKAHVASLFVTMVTALDAALAARGKLLSVTVGPKTSATDPNWAVHDYPRLGAVVDRFRVMAYDNHWRGGPPGAIAPHPWVGSVVRHTISVVPRAKVQLGVPLYGYDWPRNPDGTWGTATSLSTYETVEALRISVGATRQWSSADAAPYFTYTKNGVQHVVWYNDAYSTQWKASYVGTYGLRGLVFWHVAGEDARQWPALRSYATQRSNTITAVAPAIATYGDVLTVYGRRTTPAGAAIGGTTVWLQRKLPGATTWSTIMTSSTSATGWVSFRLTGWVNASYRLYAASTWSQLGALSPEVRTLVRWRIGSSFTDSTVARGTTAYLTGRVDPARAGTVVWRQRLVDGAWVNVASTTVRSDGTYSFGFVWTSPGTYVYRVISLSTALNAYGASPSRYLWVS